MKKLTAALENAKASSTINPDGRKLEQPAAGRLGTFSGVKVDIGAPVKTEAVRVGTFEGVVCIKPQNPNPQPVAKWPTGDASIDGPICDMLAGRKDAAA